MSITTIFPTPLLFRLKFGTVLFGVDAWCWVCREWKGYANQPWIYFPRIPTYMTTDHDTSTSQTDGRTDGQTTCHGNTALCVASRGKNTIVMISSLTKSLKTPFFCRYYVHPEIWKGYTPNEGDFIYETAWGGLVGKKSIVVTERFLLKKSTKYGTEISTRYCAITFYVLGCFFSPTHDCMGRAYSCRPKLHIA